MDDLTLARTLRTSTDDALARAPHEPDDAWYAQLEQARRRWRELRPGLSDARLERSFARAGALSLEPDIDVMDAASGLLRRLHQEFSRFSEEC